MKPKFIRFNTLLTASAIAGLPCGLSAQIVWNGAGDGSSWTDGNNWVGGISPADDITTDLAQWNGGIELDTDRSVFGLDFTGNAQLNDAGNDNTLTLGGGGIDVTGGGNGDIYADVIFAADSTITLSNRRISFRNTSTVSGAGNVTVTGGNIAYFDVAASTRTGGTTVSGGARVSIKGSTGLGSGTVTLDNGTVEDNNTAYNWTNDVVVNAGGGTLNFNGNMSGTYTGSGALTIVGSSIVSEKTTSADGAGHSGGVTLDNVRFRTANNDAYGTGTITLKNGALIKNNNNNLNIANDIVLDSTGGQFQMGWNKSIAVSGAITGDGALTIQNDSGTLNLSNTGNTYSGGTTIQGKVLATTLGDGSGTITFDGGSLKNNGNASVHNHTDVVIEAGGGSITAGWNKNITFSGVASGTGTLTVVTDSGIVAFDGESNTFSGDIAVAANGSLNVDFRFGSLGSGSYGGTISGDGDIEYAGSGTQILTATSTFTGATIVSDGILAIDGDISASASITVASGAATGGDGLVSNLTIDAGGMFLFSETDTLIDLGVTSLDSTFGVDDLIGLTAATPDGTYTLIDNGTDFSSIENFGLANAFDLGGGKLAYFQNGSLQLVVTTIPEPAVSLLAGLGVFALIRRRRS